MSVTHKTILTLNSGSSSLKFGVFANSDDDEELLLSGSAQGIGRDDGTLQIQSADGTALLHREAVHESQSEALQAIAASLQAYLHTTPIAVGHRIVHGGPHLQEHQRITPQLLQTLDEAVHFAPLHIPSALQLVRQAQEIFADATHIACFDTAFHRTMPPVAAQLPLPSHYFEEGVMRYGFHGLSYESIVHRLGSSLPERVVMAHLGNGSSVTAVFRGKSIDTSMGLTPTGGVVMGTRTGDLDPGVLLYLMRKEALNADALEALLNHRCGLAGYSDGESDMRALLQRRATGDASASLAIDAFCLSVRKTIGAYAALMGGVDLLVFTGGIGEHSDEVRAKICDGLAFLGLTPDRITVGPAQEELQMARHCRTILQ
ncbi:acetate/propionate family kinase [Terriglobus roseus]|uniref:Acetate kinase n=1 Tax=Terriglobus roseus TaxID=392734 RepID=A0A1G7IYP4_9BACT|nr:acetate/propionate family kinase [Terriglobus roseus]SDF17780.1 acetate kinase [Terriglobus roseus]